MKFKYLFFLILLSIVFSLLYIFSLFSPVSTDTKNIAFQVEKGSSLTTISNKLKEAGLIKNSFVFKYYVLFNNAQNKIQVGEFDLSPSYSLSQTLERLQKNPNEVWVTIPEGLRREEVAIKFTFSLKKDEKFTQEFLALTTSKEGYLYPDTYVFSKKVTAKQIVDKMLSTFDKKIGSDITFQQVIVSSMLERETFADSEKPIVAGIIYKRLENDWPLQIDATLQYAKGDWKPVYSIDKEIKSPFNTYKYLGLPPSPIASAGLSSLQASMNPQKSEYWYYIHDMNGNIHFAKTIEEHNANVQKYLN